MEILYIVLSIMFGLCIGSFLNVCIYRIPREESIVFPGSHCMKCGYELKWYDLIPVFSYISLKGKCRKCGDRISIQYPIIELLNAVLYLIIYLEYGYSLDTLKFMVLVSFLIVIAVIDFKTMFVYTNTIIVGAIFGIIFTLVQWYIDKSFPLDNIYGALIGTVVIGAIVLVTHGMGEGDIEIVAVSGLFLGAKCSIFMLFSGVVLGGIVAAIILILKLKDRKDEIAFGPYLAVGSILAVLVGNQIMNWYFSLL